jgi:hypothetical protein
MKDWKVLKDYPSPEEMYGRMTDILKRIEMVKDCLGESYIEGELEWLEKD